MRRIPPGEIAILGSVSDPTALSGASSIVVRDALAFVAASSVARVVSLDVSSETNPRILSFVKLSAAQDVSLAPDNHVVVGAGAKHGGGRVTILSYVPSGVLMKVGSIKDGRLEGAVSVLRPHPVDPNIILAVSAAEGGSFLVVNGTTRARPTIVAALQAAGRAAASVPLNDDGSDSVGWNPNGHKSLGGARALAVAENGIAPSSDPQPRRCPPSTPPTRTNPAWRAKCQTRGLAVSRTCVPRDREARPRNGGSRRRRRESAGRQRWWPWLGRRVGWSC